MANPGGAWWGGMVACGLTVLSPTVAAETGAVTAPGGAAVSEGATRRGVAPGDPAPPFDVQTRDGSHLTSSDLHGKVVVLNLWASWCPPCLEELPSLERLRRQMVGTDVVIVGVSVDKSWEDVDKVVKETGVAITMALDPAQDVARAYGTDKFPETYVINPKGVVVRKFIGEQIWDRGDFVNYFRELAK